jgi:hypothetical protein
LYFGKGLPRKWVISGKEIEIEGAPTRWGKVSLKIAADSSAKNIKANVDLKRPGSPREIQVKLRLPKQNALRKAVVNGRPAVIGGPHTDSVVIQTGSEKRFQIVAEFS